jgi:hypothetical protein
MRYLVAVFIPPVYFLTRKKWLGFGVASFLLVVSFFFYITIALIPVALILWFLCSICAVWDLKKELMREHATLIAEKMADKLTGQSQSRTPSSPPPITRP